MPPISYEIVGMVDIRPIAWTIKKDYKILVKL